MNNGEYKVIKFFTDMHDADFAYNVGDTFPRAGKTVDNARLVELSTRNNRQGRPLIKFVSAENQVSDIAVTGADSPAPTVTVTDADDVKVVRRGRRKKNVE